MIRSNVNLDVLDLQFWVLWLCEDLIRGFIKIKIKNDFNLFLACSKLTIVFNMENKAVTGGIVLMFQYVADIQLIDVR